MKKLVIAEKPSVAADIARALGKVTKRKDGVFENDEWIVYHALGHLVELCMPDFYDKKWKFWKLADLPILPNPFKLQPIEDSKKVFDQIHELIQRPDVGVVINACDAGREGELIFRYLVEMAGSRLPVKRLWLSSMTPAAIRDGFKKLRDASELDSLGEAARCRSEADWLVGINGTRAFTVKLHGSAGKSKQMAPVGRVQTPTLAMLCEREQRILDFVPRPFWEVTAQFGIRSGEYSGKWFDPKFVKTKAENDDDRPDSKADRLVDEERARSIVKKCTGKTGTVSEEKKPASQASPLLFDLTTLQREANGKFGFPARKTLSVAQSLYERHKMLTYPRTDSRCLPEDYIGTAVASLNALGSAGGDLAPHAAKAVESGWVRPNKRIFNNAKVSDHFAIIPTGEFSSNLSPDEMKLFYLVARRFVAVFFPSAQFEVTTRITVVEGESFKTEGKILRDPGWLAVYGKEEQGDDVRVPPWNPGEKADVLAIEMAGLMTKAPARYSEATLLTAMETAGKLLDDDALAEAMKERGLGTPATRADTIEKLLSEHYILREGRELRPTDKGMEMIRILRDIGADALVSPALTGEWEHKLRMMEQGQMTRTAFMAEMVTLACDIVEKAKGIRHEETIGEVLPVKSPVDGAAIYEKLKTYESETGTFKVYKEVGGRKVRREEICELIQKGMIGPLDGFFSQRTRKAYSAALKLDASTEWKVKLVFDNSPVGADGVALDFSKETPVAKCPLCETGRVFGTAMAYMCENTLSEDKACKFKVSRKLCGRDMQPEEIRALCEEGRTPVLEKFWSARTRRPFSAILVKNPEKGWTFEFPPRAPKAGGGKAGARRAGAQRAAPVAKTKAAAKPAAAKSKSKTVRSKTAKVVAAKE
jgi:DNA topoisomerase-3